MPRTIISKDCGVPSTNVHLRADNTYAVYHESNDSCFAKCRLVQQPGHPIDFQVDSKAFASIYAVQIWISHLKTVCNQEDVDQALV